MSTAEPSRKFHFIREIASGGFGSVFLAKVVHQDGFSRLVAIKLLHAKWSENEEIASRMRDEARLLGWLRHKNIVDVLDLTKIDGRWAVIMEYLEGIDLKGVIQHCRQEGTQVPLRAALEICASSASALDAAYNRPPYAGEKPLRVIHRDIKPSNIMVDEQGTVKVLDFGVARAEFDEREAHTQELAFGSLDYMPPERLFFEPETPSSDMYSLGATVFELLCLEKFGKAKLRPKDHEQYISERFDRMFDRHPMPSVEVEDEVYDILADMLAFAEPTRTSAANAVAKARALSRRLQMAGLEEWAERTVPQLLRANRLEPETPSPLVGKIISEDTRAFEESGLGGPPGELPPGVREDPPSGYALGNDVDESELDETARQDDARWSALKQATINELAGATAQALPTAQTQRTDEAPLEVLVPKKQPRPAPPTPKKVRIASGGAPVPAPGPGIGSRLMLVLLFGGFAVVLLLAAGMLGLATGMKLLGVSSETAPILVPATGGEEAPAEASKARESGPHSPEAVSPPSSDERAGVPSAPLDDPGSQPLPTRDTRPAPAEIAPAAAGGSILEEGPKDDPGSGAVFSSGFPDTRKISVRCDGGSGQGTDEVSVASESLGDCTVTVIDRNRSRKTVVVKDVQPGRYACFADGSDDCR